MNLSRAKVYFDGSHWIAIPHTERKFQPRRIAAPPPEDAEKIKEFEEAFKEVRKGKRETRKKAILEEVSSLFSTKEDAEQFVEKHFDRLSRNRWERCKRMKRRAYLYPWDYFATFTYDDKKHTEESFRKQLMNCLYHLANRKKWRYMGVWERGEIGQRLHFHALICVPKGTMPGTLEQHQDYSTKRKQWENTLQSSFFNDRFGRSDFDAIEHERQVADSVGYMLKYITKSDEKVVYSRGLKTYMVSDILDDDILCKIGDEDQGYRYILSPDFTCISDGQIMGKVSFDVIDKMPKAN